MKNGLFAVALFCFALQSSPARAQSNVTWNGGTGNWTVSGNWTPSVVPNNSGSTVYNAFIDGGRSVNSQVLLNSNAAIGDLTLDHGDSLTIQGLPNAPSQLVAGGNVLINGILNVGVNGSLNLSSQLTVGSGGVLNNSGIFGSSTLLPNLTVNADGIVNNYGTFGDGMLQISGTLNNWGDIQHHGVTVNQGGVLNNFGALPLSDWGGLDVHGVLYNAEGASIGGVDVALGLTGTGVFLNAGTLTLGNVRVAFDGTFTNLPTGTVTSLLRAISFSNGFQNQGALELGYSGNMHVTGNFLNSGNVNILSDSALTVQGSYIQTAGQTTVDTSCCGNPLLSVLGGQIAILGGTLQGGGSGLASDSPLAGNVFMNGRLEPSNPSLGLSTGVLMVNGNYTQSNAGIYTADLGGLLVGAEYDQVQISGQAILNGILKLVVSSNFLPQIGNSFAIMTFGSSSGMFRSVSWLGLPQGLIFKINYNPNNVTAVVAQSPEPASLILFSTGMCVVMGVRRRRQFRNSRSH